LRVFYGQDERFLRNNALKKVQREAVISKRSDFSSILKKENKNSLIGQFKLKRQELNLSK